MDVGSWTGGATVTLKSAGIDSARLDCLIMLEDALGRDRSWILAHPEHKLDISQIDDLNTKVMQRASHLPLAYIRGHVEFYGRDFVVNKHVLVPRPDSEAMIELLLEQAHAAEHARSSLRIIDVGTGSGALAITAKLELPQSHVTGIDIDPECLAVAKMNAAKLRASITLASADLLQPNVQKRPLYGFDFLLANLPYVPDEFAINPAAGHEPRLALFGGKDGLDLYRRLFDDLSQRQSQLPSLHAIITEALEPQHPELARIAQAAGYRLDKTYNLAQIYRLG